MKQLRIIRLNYLHWRVDLKYVTALVLLVVLSYNNIHGMAEFARDLGVSITPWAFPFIPRNFIHFLTIMFAFFLVISDAPFRTKQQQFVILRTGKRTWLCGQLLYLLTVSVGLAVLLWVLSWVVLLPQVEWRNEWGAAWTSAATVGSYGFYGVRLQIEYETIKNTDPATLTLWCVTAMACVCFMLSLIMTACNLWLKQGWGAVIVTALMALGAVPYFFSIQPGWIKMLIWVSPLTWMDRTKMGHTNQSLPSYSYAILAPLIVGAVLSLILIATIHKCNLETDKE